MNRPPIHRWLCAALLLALLASQALAAAHEVEHWSGESEACAVCSIGQPLDSGVPVAAGENATAPIHVMPAPATGPAPARQFTVPYQGRAPPFCA